MWKLVLLALVATSFAGPLRPKKGDPKSFQMDIGNGVWVDLPCGPGTVFSADLNTCILAPAPVVQSKSKCADPKVLYFADDKTCNAYYQCSNGQEFRHCCPAGTGFNATSNNCEFTGCTKKPDCVVLQIEKSNVTTTQGPPPAKCQRFNWYYEVNPKQVGGYVMTSVKNASAEAQFLSCPNKGTFSTRPHVCGCIGGIKIKAEPDCVKLDFNSADKLDFSSPQVWVAPTNVKKTKQMACFNKDGQLNVPYYSYMDLGNSLTITMKAQGTDGVLIKNGEQTDCKTSSVKIEVASGNVKASIETSVQVYTVETPLVGDMITMKYNGKELSLNKKAVPAEGNIKMTKCDVIIGAKFTGCIDNVSICK